MSFQLGSLIVPDFAGFDIEQQYQPIGGESIFRTYSGRGLKQMSWQKLRVTTSGTGWIAAALPSLDYTLQMPLRCVVPRSLAANPATRQVTLPSARRTDAGWTPFGIAILRNGQAVQVGLELIADVATLSAADGAVLYQACYYPQLTVWAYRPSQSGNRGDATHRWEVVCEEV